MNFYEIKLKHPLAKIDCCGLLRGHSLMKKLHV